jgi:hypothetical protein
MQSGKPRNTKRPRHTHNTPVRTWSSSSTSVRDPLGEGQLLTTQAAAATAATAGAGQKPSQQQATQHMQRQTRTCQKQGGGCASASVRMNGESIWYMQLGCTHMHAHKMGETISGGQNCAGVALPCDSSSSALLCEGCARAQNTAHAVGSKNNSTITGVLLCDA